MVLLCRCGRWRLAHDSSMSVIEQMCMKCKEESIRKLRLRPAPRGPSRPFDDYNPRSKHVRKISVSLLTSIIMNKQTKQCSSR